MKKRILALALAGTTAFSVFGAAMSASAVVVDSTHTYSENIDAYQSYNPVARQITATSTKTDTATYGIDKNKIKDGVPATFKIDTKADHANGVFTSVDDYIKYTYDITSEYAAETLYTFTSKLSTDSNYKKVEAGLMLVEADNKLANGDTNYEIWVYDSTNEKLTTGKAWKIEGTFYVDSTVNVPADNWIPADKIYYEGSLADTATTALQKAHNADSKYWEVTKYVPTTEGTVAVKDGKITDKTGANVGDKIGNTSVDSSYSYPNDATGNVPTYDTVDKLLDAIGKKYDSTTATQYRKVTDAKVDVDVLDATAYGKLKTYEQYAANITTDSDTTTDSTNLKIEVKAKNRTTGGKTEWKAVKQADNSYKQEYKDWSFNGDMTGEATVSVYSTKTTIKDGVLDVYTEEAPTIYAYDFLPVNATYSDAGTIAYNWNYGTMAAAAGSIVPYNAAGNTTVLYAETGRGRQNMGVRYDIVSNWIDFLDELAINYDNGYRETLAEFKDNYNEIYYKDPVYDSRTGKLLGYNKADLYNLDDLLEDIFAYNNYAAYSQANTSELVYLMQQYNKYFEGYVDKDEVAVSEWGELLLSILESAEEANFKKAADYKKYVNKVDDLADAYEDATTVAQINKAEKAMYELLTSVPYTAATVSKTELNNTMEDLFFNVGSVPASYAVAPSTASNNVDYSNYDYYVSVAKVSGTSYEFTTTLTKGFYSLYPMADYYEKGNDVEVYSGNKAAADYDGYATDEYEWFWNVYQLAYNMKASNKYQGAIDAVDAALKEAVEALDVTVTPYATETSAMDEMVDEYAGKIESDYNTGYYAKYTQANDFAGKAEGKLQTRIARNIVGVAGEALTYQGTQITVTSKDIKALKAKITEGEKAIDAIKNSADYNAAQVNELNRAIAAAQDIVDLYNGTYTNTKTYSKSGMTVNHTYSTLVGDKDQFVKSDLDNAIEGIDNAINYSSIVMGWSKNEAGKWMYGTENGYLNDGWHQVEGKATWYWFNEDGTAKQSEWAQINGKWYWFNSNAGAATGWAKVDGSWYYFKGDCSMKTGWEKVDGNWYYMNNGGKMVTGWAQINGKWYYFSKESNSLGQMLYNTTTPDGYKVDANGAMIEK